MTHEDATRLFYSHIWPHRATVLRTATFLARSAADADDVAQETLLKAFRSIEQFDPASNAKAWLSAILRNTWIDRRRASGRDLSVGSVSLEESELDVAAEESAANVSAMSPQELMEQIGDQELIDALRSLPEEIRWTLLLVDVQQLDHVAAAEALGVPEGTIKSRAHRGRRMLHDRLAKDRENETRTREVRR